MPVILVNDKENKRRNARGWRFCSQLAERISSNAINNNNTLPPFVSNFSIPFDQIISQHSRRSRRDTVPIPSPTVSRAPPRPRPSSSAYIPPRRRRASSAVPPRRCGSRACGGRLELLGCSAGRARRDRVTSRGGSLGLYTSSRPPGLPRLRAPAPGVPAARTCTALVHLCPPRRPGDERQGPLLAQPRRKQPQVAPRPAQHLPAHRWVSFRCSRALYRHSWPFFAQSICIPLAAALCLSIVNSSCRKSTEPDGFYLSVAVFALILTSSLLAASPAIFSRLFGP